MSSLASAKFGDKGYDLTDIYVGDIKFLRADNQDYVEYESDNEYLADLKTLVSRLNENPYVEIATVGDNALPYSWDYYGNQLSCITDTGLVNYSGNRRVVTPDFIRAIRLRGVNGETPEQLAGMMERGGSFISPTQYEDKAQCEVMKGKDSYMDNDSSKIVRISALVPPIQRNDFEPSNGVILVNIDHQDVFPGEMIIRIKPGKWSDFMVSVNPRDLQIRNVYVTNIQSIETRKEANQKPIYDMIRTFVTSSLFLMVAIFLGFLGTFWFRTQQRVPEIALRMVNGATRGQVFRRLLSEGIVLLLFSALIFGGLAYYSMNAGLFSSILYYECDWLIIPAIIADIVALAIMIIAGIWAPARKAMAINPSQALKDI